jgi:NAD+ kinase
MPPFQGASVDVAVVHKRTALERYANEFNSGAGRSYFLREGQSTQALAEAHESHCKTLDSLLTLLTQLKLSFSLQTLDDLSPAQTALPAYFRGGVCTGVTSKLNLVISVGGDGTLLRTSHFVGGDTRLLGVNSVPQHSVGHLCTLRPETLEAGLTSILDGKRKPKKARRLVARTSAGQYLPYALNDIYFGHQHPASASRYTLTIEGPHTRSEKQISSGIWLATPAGSTAAIRSYGLAPLETTSQQFLLAVREPYTSPAHPLSLTKLTLDGNHDTVTLLSRMRHGIVCVDGPWTSAALGFGDTLEAGLSEEGALRLFL